MTSQFSSFDYSPAAKEVMGAATRAGITKESIGQWMALAVTHERRGNSTEAAECARRAIEIHETWGPLRQSYAMCAGVLSHARAIIAASED